MTKIKFHGFRWGIFPYNEWKKIQKSSKINGQIIWFIKPEFNQEYVDDQEHMWYCYIYDLQEHKHHHVQGFGIKPS